MTSPCCCFPAGSGPFHPISPKALWCQFELCYFEALPCLALLRVVHFIVIADQKMRNSVAFFFFFFAFHSVFSVLCGQISLDKGLINFIFLVVSGFLPTKKEACDKQTTSIFCLPNCTQAGSFFFMHQAPYCYTEPWRVLAFHLPRLHGCAHHACNTRSDC